MFRFTRKPSSGSHSQYLVKITHSVQCGYMEVVQTMSVLWLHNMTCEACVHSTHASQVVCISWTIKCLIALKHGVTMTFIRQLFLFEFWLYARTPSVNLWKRLQNFKSHVT